MRFQSYSGSLSYTTEKFSRPFLNVLDTFSASRYTTGMQSALPAFFLSEQRWQTLSNPASYATGKISRSYNQ